MPLTSCSSINTKANFTVHVIITTIINRLLLEQVGQYRIHTEINGTCYTSIDMTFAELNTTVIVKVNAKK